MKLPDNTKIQSASLRVKDLKRSLNFYSHLVGFKIISENETSAQLSATGNLPYIISMHEDKNAIHQPRGTTGLFHIAIRLPNRKELARIFLRLFDNKVKFRGFSDHLVSEAIYLEDPDENGVELYTDKPREEWQYDMGQVQMATLPLDLTVLTNELDDRDVWNGIHPDTDMGHIHLSVSNINKAQHVYSMILGMNISNSTYSGAMFFAAGGYHHHIGVNVWSSKNGYPAPENSAGLINFTIKIPDIEYLKEIEKKSAESGLIEKPYDGNNMVILDFDKNKITVTL